MTPNTEESSMRRHTRWSASAAFGLALALSLTLTASVYGQGGSGLGVGSGSNPWDENSRTPFEITMSGFLNTKPEEGNIEVVTLGISSFGEQYQYEIMDIAAPNYPQMSTRMILQKVGQRGIDFNLIGPRALLSKVAQSPPGTPLKIVGLFEQNRQRLRLTDVTVLGME